MPMTKGYNNVGNKPANSTQGANGFQKVVKPSGMKSGNGDGTSVSNTAHRGSGGIGQAVGTVK